MVGAIAFVHSGEDVADMHVLASESRTTIPAALMLHVVLVDEENEAYAHNTLDSLPASLVMSSSHIVHTA